MNSQQAAPPDDVVGRILLGRYRIVRELAKGGMGIVYLARAEGAVGFVKPVVVKLVLPEHASDRRFLGMFVREAKILSGLRHPSIVDVIEFGEEDGAYVMVLEYVRGYHLGQWNKYLRKKGQEIPTEVLLLLIVDVLEALHTAHSMVNPDGTPMHIVHRDVSPSNILLDEHGRARLLDFGVARARGGNVDYQTQVKSFVGKLTYSAPEMFTEAEGTPQTDLYSCGVVLHEMLFGRNVFSGKNQANTLNLVLNHQPESVEGLRPDIPQGLDAVLRKALAKAPSERFASAREMAIALRNLQREHESEVRARLAAQLKLDFGEEMATMLGIESLSARDEAWRRLSLHPPPDSEHTMAVDLDELGQPAQQTTRPRANTLRGPAVAAAASDVPAETVKRRGDGFQTGRLAQVQTGRLPGVQTGRLPGVQTGRMPAIQTGRLPAVPALPPPAFPLPTGAGLPQAPRPAGSSRLMIVGLAVVACLAIVSIVVSIQGKQPASVVPPIRVVTEPHDPPATVNTTAPPSLQPIGTTKGLPNVPSEPSAGEKPRGSRPPAEGPSPQSITRAFRKQQNKITACFAQHAVSVQGLPEMQLEFDLDKTGKPQKVGVTPAALSSTPLGRCLREVGSATRFPAQGSAVSFAIPITVGAGGT